TNRMSEPLRRYPSVVCRGQPPAVLGAVRLPAGRWAVVRGVRKVEVNGWRLETGQEVVNRHRIAVDVDHGQQPSEKRGPGAEQMDASHGPLPGGPAPKVETVLVVRPLRPVQADPCPHSKLFQQVEPLVGEQYPVAL